MSGAPGIAQCIGAFETPYDLCNQISASHCILLKRYDGTLLDVLVHHKYHVPHCLIFYMLHDISLALAQMHKQGIWHADVKPENVFVACTNYRFDFVLGDMDLALIADSAGFVPAARLIRGTKEFAAPETWTPVSANPYVRIQTVVSRDVWSLGMVLLYMLASEFYFDALLTRELPWVLWDVSDERDRLYGEAVKDMNAYVASCVNDDKKAAGWVDIIVPLLHPVSTRRPTAAQVHESTVKGYAIIQGCNTAQK